MMTDDIVNAVLTLTPDVKFSVWENPTNYMGEDNPIIVAYNGSTFYISWNPANTTARPSAGEILAQLQG